MISSAAPEFGLNARRSVSATTLAVNLQDLSDQLHILAGSRTRSPLAHQPLMIAAATDTERVAEQFDTMSLLHLVDGPVASVGFSQTIPRLFLTPLVAGLSSRSFWPVLAPTDAAPLPPRPWPVQRKFYFRGQTPRTLREPSANPPRTLREPFDAPPWQAAGTSRLGGIRL
jgi:hypothetical protein